MKNIILIVISVSVVIGLSVLVFMNLPENEDISTQDTTVSPTRNQELDNVVLEDDEELEMEQDIMKEDMEEVDNSTKSNQNSTFTMNEVSSHNSKDDCYLVIRDNVYDVSSFIDSHPGGAEKIIEKCGQEVTGIFAQIHSNRAWDLLVDYKIGTITN